MKSNTLLCFKERDNFPFLIMWCKEGSQKPMCQQKAKSNNFHHGDYVRKFNWLFCHNRTKRLWQPNLSLLGCLIIFLHDIRSNMCVWIRKMTYSTNSKRHNITRIYTCVRIQNCNIYTHIYGLPTSFYRRIIHFFYFLYNMHPYIV